MPFKSIIDGRLAPLQLFPHAAGEDLLAFQQIGYQFQVSLVADDDFCRMESFQRLGDEKRTIPRTQTYDGKPTRATASVTSAVFCFVMSNWLLCALSSAVASHTLATPIWASTVPDGFGTATFSISWRE